MSFLDNLENNLRALERQEERDPAQQQRQREAEDAKRLEAERVAPLADELKRGKFANDLLGTLRTLGHERKVFVRITFVEETLRLEAKGRVMDLVPTMEGVVAQERDGKPRLVDLSSDGVAFARDWLDRLE
jgi:hypothetical protein